MKNLDRLDPHFRHQRTHSGSVALPDPFDASWANTHAMREAVPGVNPGYVRKWVWWHMGVGRLWYRVVDEQKTPTG